MYPQRKSHLIKGFDYSKAGYYFITICTHERKKLFGEVVDGKMILNEAGENAHECWKSIPDHYPNVVLEEFVIMPDHVHGIIRIPFDPEKRVPDQRHEFGKVIPSSVGLMIKGFKIGVTVWFRKRGNADKIWQIKYHCRIVSWRNIGRVNDYIDHNPQNYKGS